MNCPRCGYPSRRHTARHLDDRIDPLATVVTRNRDTATRAAVLKYMDDPASFYVLAFDEVCFIDERIVAEGNTFKHSIRGAYLPCAVPLLIVSPATIYQNGEL